MRKPIKLEFNIENLVKVLEYGQNVAGSEYCHMQIVDWCESFWSEYCDVDTEGEVKKIIPILEEVDSQWDLYLANTYTLGELKSLDLTEVELPSEWFEKWIEQVRK